MFKQAESRRGLNYCGWKGLLSSQEILQKQKGLSSGAYFADFFLKITKMLMHRVLGHLLRGPSRL